MDMCDSHQTYIMTRSRVVVFIIMEKILLTNIIEYCIDIA